MTNNKEIEAMNRVFERMEISEPYRNIWNDEFIVIDYLYKRVSDLEKQVKELRDKNDK